MSAGDNTFGRQEVGRAGKEVVPPYLTEVHSGLPPCINKLFSFFHPASHMRFALAFRNIGTPALVLSSVSSILCLGNVHTKIVGRLWLVSYVSQPCLLPSFAVQFKLSGACHPEVDRWWLAATDRFILAVAGLARSSFVQCTYCVSFLAGGICLSACRLCFSKTFRLQFFRRPSRFER